jgi:hypothetical protein
MVQNMSILTLGSVILSPKNNSLAINSERDKRRAK